MKPIPVFYRPEQSANTESFSPSASKPARLMELWRGQNQIDVRSFEPTTVDQLSLVHDRAFVEDVLALKRPNGFDNFDASVAASLPYTSGSMLAAALHVAEHGGVACSPTSGFHHAGWDFAGGYCTFNGLALAAVILQQQGIKVGILDGDAHYGNGTDDILHRFGLGIKHHTWGKDFPCGEVVSDSKAWRWYTRAVDDLQDCDVVLYQASADPHIDDPLGGQLRDKALMMREHIVFGGLKRVAWNLAGGYRKDQDGGISGVLRTHTNTLGVSHRAHNNEDLM